MSNYTTEDFTEDPLETTEYYNATMEHFPSYLNFGEQWSALEILSASLIAFGLTIILGIAACFVYLKCRKTKVPGITEDNGNPIPVTGAATSDIYTIELGSE